jgi:hypothetical protein
MYKIALFLHVTGALSLSAAIAIEWFCTVNFRKSGAVHELVSNYSKIAKLGDIAAFLILIPGIYMMIAVWDDAPWGISGFFGLILIGVIGGTLTGRKIKKIKKLMTENGKSSQELGQLLNNNSLSFSIRIRTAVFLGVIFLMTAKPGLAGSVATLAISLIIGALPLRMKYYLSDSKLERIR